jgi:actin
MKKIWHDIFDNELQVDFVEYPVILIELPFDPKDKREKMVQLDFETFNVPSFSVGISAVFALCGSSRTTGIVFEAEEGVSHVAPIYESSDLPHATESLDVAGRELTVWPGKRLNERDDTLMGLDECESLPVMKEKVGLCHPRLRGRIPEGRPND